MFRIIGLGCLAAELEEHVTLDLGLMSLSPTLGVEITSKQNKTKTFKRAGTHKMSTRNRMYSSERDK